MEHGLNLEEWIVEPSFRVIVVFTGICGTLPFIHRTRTVTQTLVHTA